MSASRVKVLLTRQAPVVAHTVSCKNALRCVQSHDSNKWMGADVSVNILC